MSALDGKIGYGHKAYPPQEGFIQISILSVFTDFTVELGHQEIT